MVICIVIYGNIPRRFRRQVRKSKMKRILMLSMLMLFVVSVSLPALHAAGGGKRKIVFAGIGAASSDLGGLFMDIGLEKRFFGNFYGQFLFDYYFNPFDKPGISDSYAYGINLYGVYRIPVSTKINFFLKAGFHWTTLKKNYETSRIVHRKDYGIAGGGGIECRLSETVFIHAGATVKYAYDEDEVDHKWVKLYGGVVFRLK